MLEATTVIIPSADDKPAKLVQIAEIDGMPGNVGWSYDPLLTLTPHSAWRLALDLLSELRDQHGFNLHKNGELNRILLVPDHTRTTQEAPRA